MTSGVIVSRGTSTGRTTTDNCEILAQVPEAGRDVSGGTANVTVNLVAPGTMYGGRHNQLDLRFGKVLRTGQLRTVVSVDVYNALNANPVLTENAAYRDTPLSVWRIPTSILPARFVKFGVQVDF
jgi:hypothetical protein